MTTIENLTEEQLHQIIKDIKTNYRTYQILNSGTIEYNNEEIELHKADLTQTQKNIDTMDDSEIIMSILKNQIIYNLDPFRFFQIKDCINNTPKPILKFKQCKFFNLNNINIDENMAFTGCEFQVNVKQNSEMIHLSSGHLTIKFP